MAQFESQKPIPRSLVLPSKDGDFYAERPDGIAAAMGIEDEV